MELLLMSIAGKNLADVHQLVYNQLPGYWHLFTYDPTAKFDFTGSSSLLWHAQDLQARTKFGKLEVLQWDARKHVVQQHLR